MLLADQRWTDLEGRHPTVVLPLGACEQHGPHLPLDTDARVASAVARRAVAELTGELDVLLAPAQPYAASGEHEGFAGTVSIGQEALRALLVEVGRSMLRWAGRLLIVNGHGGNHESLAQAVARLRYEERDVAWWSCASVGGDAHAGGTETSLMLALRPESVNLAAAEPGRTEPLSELMGQLARDGVRAVSRSGVLGDPTGASAGKGNAMLAELVRRLCTRTRDWRVDASGRLSPVQEVVTS